ncbi:MAG: hypothetical protein F6K35_12560 [Okeania sp. SIO2H7]|nr:hypothetical protein [Okeania sp. SIO2H7]
MKPRYDDGKFSPENKKIGARLRRMVGFRPYQKYYDLCNEIGVELNGKFLESLLKKYLQEKTGETFDD